MRFDSIKICGEQNSCKNAYYAEMMHTYNKEAGGKAQTLLITTEPGAQLNIEKIKKN